MYTYLCMCEIALFHILAALDYLSKCVATRCVKHFAIEEIIAANIEILQKREK